MDRDPSPPFGASPRDGAAGEFPGEAPGIDEVPAVAWPLLFRDRLHRRLRDRDRYPWWVLATVLAGLFAVGFTITIVAVSLGDIAEDLDASTSALTWAVTGPWLVLALAMPIFGKLGDVRGHRRVYLWGFAGYTIGAAVTALAFDGGSFIAARVLGSLPAAAIGPTSMALIMRAFPDDERVKAMGWWALVGAGAPVVGLIAGGPLVEAFGWRWLFVVQMPLSLFALAVAVLVLHETPRRPREPVDVAGALSIGTATVAALLGLTFGAELGWAHPLVLALFGVAPVALWTFVCCERRATHPLLPLAFFRRRNFTASLVAQFGANFAYMGGFIITPLLMDSAFGYSVAATSLAMTVRPLSNSLASPVGGYVAARVGERRVALVGCVLIAISMLLFAIAAASGALTAVFGALLLSGIGLGGSAPSLITCAANTVAVEDLGVANAAQQMVAQIGVVAGIQVLSTIQHGSDSAGPFVAAYLTGGVFAVVGVIGAASVSRRRLRVATGYAGASPTARRSA
jgi:EmrB/QacA subfamily drug resistance transporter